MKSYFALLPSISKLTIRQLGLLTICLLLNTSSLWSQNDARTIWGYSEDINKLINRRLRIDRQKKRDLIQEIDEISKNASTLGQAKDMIWQKIKSLEELNQDDQEKHRVFLFNHYDEIQPVTNPGGVLTNLIKENLERITKDFKVGLNYICNEKIRDSMENVINTLFGEIKNELGDDKYANNPEEIKELLLKKLKRLRTSGANLPGTNEQEVNDYTNLKTCYRKFLNWIRNEVEVYFETQPPQDEYISVIGDNEDLLTLQELGDGFEADAYGTGKNTGIVANLVITNNTPREATIYIERQLITNKINQIYGTVKEYLVKSRPFSTDTLPLLGECVTFSRPEQGFWQKFPTDPKIEWIPQSQAIPIPSHQTEVLESGNYKFLSSTQKEYSITYLNTNEAFPFYFEDLNKHPKEVAGIVLTVLPHIYYHVEKKQREEGIETIFDADEENETQQLINLIKWYYFSCHFEDDCYDKQRFAEAFLEDLKKETGLEYWEYPPEIKREIIQVLDKLWEDGLKVAEELGLLTREEIMGPQDRPVQENVFEVIDEEFAAILDAQIAKYGPPGIECVKKAYSVTPGTGYDLSRYLFVNKRLEMDMITAFDNMQLHVRKVAFMAELVKKYRAQHGHIATSKPHPDLSIDQKLLYLDDPVIPFPKGALVFIIDLCSEEAYQKHIGDFLVTEQCRFNQIEYWIKDYEDKIKDFGQPRMVGKNHIEHVEQLIKENIEDYEAEFPYLNEETKAKIKNEAMENLAQIQAALEQEIVPALKKQVRIGRKMVSEQHWRKLIDRAIARSGCCCEFEDGSGPSGGCQPLEIRFR